MASAITSSEKTQFSENHNILEKNSMIPEHAAPAASQHTLKFLASQPQISDFLNEKNTAVYSGKKEDGSPGSEDALTKGTRTNVKRQPYNTQTHSEPESSDSAPSPSCGYIAEHDVLIGWITKPIFTDTKDAGKKPEESTAKKKINKQKQKRQQPNTPEVISEQEHKTKPELLTLLKDAILSKSRNRHTAQDDDIDISLYGSIAVRQIENYNQICCQLSKDVVNKLKSTPRDVLNNKPLILEEVLSGYVGKAIKLTKEYQSIHEELLQNLSGDRFRKTINSSNHEVISYTRVLEADKLTLNALYITFKTVKDFVRKDLAEIEDASPIEPPSSQAVSFFESKIEFGKFLCWSLNAMDEIRNLDLPIAEKLPELIITDLDEQILTCYQAHLENSIRQYQKIRGFKSIKQLQIHDETIINLNLILQKQLSVFTCFKKGSSLSPDNMSIKYTEQQITDTLKLSYDICIIHFACRNLTMLADALTTLDGTFMFLQNYRAAAVPASDPVTPSAATAGSDTQDTKDLCEDINFFTGKFDLIRIFLKEISIQIQPPQSLPPEKPDHEYTQRLKMDNLTMTMKNSFESGFLKWLHEKYLRRQRQLGEKVQEDKKVLIALENKQKSSSNLIKSLIKGKKIQEELLRTLQTMRKNNEKKIKERAQHIENNNKELKMHFDRMLKLLNSKEQLTSASDHTTAGQNKDDIEELIKNENVFLTAVAAKVSELSLEPDVKAMISERNRLISNITETKSHIDNGSKEITAQLKDHRTYETKYRALKKSVEADEAEIKKISPSPEVEVLVQTLELHCEKLNENNKQYEQFKEELRQADIQQSEAFCQQLLQELELEKLEREKKTQKNKRIAALPPAQQKQSETEDDNGAEQASAINIVKPYDPTQEPAPAIASGENFNLEQLNKLAAEKNWSALMLTMKKVRTNNGRWDTCKSLQSITLLKTSLEKMNAERQGSCQLIIEYSLLVIEFTFEVSYELTADMVKCNSMLTKYGQQVGCANAAVTKSRDAVIISLIKSWPAKMQELEALSSQYLPDIHKQLSLIFAQLSKVEADTACELKKCFDFLSAKTQELKEKIQKLSGLHCVNFEELYLKRGEHMKKLGLRGVRKRTESILNRTLIREAEKAEQKGHLIVSDIITVLETSTVSYLKLNQQAQEQLNMFKSN